MSLDSYQRSLLRALLLPGNGITATSRSLTATSCVEGSRVARAVAFVGTIGFVGLVAPHVARILVGRGSARLPDRLGPVRSTVAVARISGERCRGTRGRQVGRAVRSLPPSATVRLAPSPQGEGRLTRFYRIRLR
jgi:hypothetical protein